MEKNSGDPLRNQQLHLRTRRLVPSRERPASPPEFSKPSRLTCRGCITPMRPAKLPHFFKRRCNYSALQLINPRRPTAACGNIFHRFKGNKRLLLVGTPTVGGFRSDVGFHNVSSRYDLSERTRCSYRFTARAPRGFYRFVVDAGANV